MAVSEGRSDRSVKEEKRGRFGVTLGFENPINARDMTGKDELVACSQLFILLFLTVKNTM